MPKSEKREVPSSKAAPAVRAHHVRIVKEVPSPQDGEGAYRITYESFDKHQRSLGKHDRIVHFAEP